MLSGARIEKAQTIRCNNFWDKSSKIDWTPNHSLCDEHWWRTTHSDRLSALAVVDAIESILHPATIIGSSLNDAAL